MYKYWKQIDEIINNTLVLEPDLRITYLQEQCGSNPEMLREAIDYLRFIEKAENEHFLESGLLSSSILVDEVSTFFNREDTLEQILGMQIGPYIIRNILGEGGMGTVYLADRVDGEFEQSVAIKFLRNGFFSFYLRERFNQEKKILSKVNHPNIASLLDGGVTHDGQPYFIMEYVEGKPIDVYCTENKLPVQERISLFLQLCKAVQFAHSKLIIHRDLKPDNIYVDMEGRIKVMDFGIAKLLAPELDDSSTHQTHEGHLIASFDFAAPEQVKSGDATVQTDVYGLGALLYVLSTGEPVFHFKNKSISEIQSTICREQPVKPGDRTNPEIGTIPNDLEAIILKALRKEPENRYESVGHLTDDIERMKKGLPVLARQGKLRYRTGKFIKRNKSVLSAAVILLFAILSFSFYHVHELTEERNIAEAEAEKAQAVTVFLTDIFRSADPAQNITDTLTVYDLLDRGKTRINLMDDKPELQVEFMLAIGNSYQKLGSYEEAEVLYTVADSLTQTLFEPNSVQVANTAFHLGSLKEADRSFEYAKFYYLKAAELLEQQPELFWNRKASIYAGLGNAFTELGETDSAEVYLNQSIAIRELYNVGEVNLLKTKVNLAKVYRGQEKYELAEQLYLDVLSELETQESPDLTLMAITLNNLGYLQKTVGNFSGAEFYYRRSLELQNELYGKDHPNSIMILTNLASVLIDLGNYDETLQILKKSLSLTKNRYGTHWRTGTAIGAIGRFHFEWEEFDRAAERLLESETIYREVLGADHVWTGIESLYHHVALKNLERFNESISSLPAFKAIDQKRDVFTYVDSIKVAQLIDKTDEFSIVDMEEDIRQLKAILNR